MLRMLNIKAEKNVWKPVMIKVNARIEFFISERFPKPLLIHFIKIER
jgi:hypothetical protein